MELQRALVWQNVTRRGLAVSQLRREPRQRKTLAYKRSYFSEPNWFFAIPVGAFKNKIPKPNNVRFRNLLVTRTGLEPMLPP